ncbi:hypothetical protein B481_0722 [Planococcus halocryophilus Or1]|nr:hypothetical protein B481_0722 [Planococcus halocryophilus Or1]
MAMGGFRISKAIGWLSSALVAIEHPMRGKIVIINNRKRAILLKFTCLTP